MSASAKAVAALLALTLATGCGVRPDSAPRDVDDVVVTADPAGLAARPVAVTAYVVRDRTVVLVRRLVAAPATPAQRLAAAGVRPRAVSARGGVVLVDLPAPPDALVVAQVVLTLTEAPEVTAVRFAVDGVPAAVPRPDGSRTREPLARAAFAGFTG